VSKFYTGNCRKEGKMVCRTALNRKFTDLTHGTSIARYKPMKDFKVQNSFLSLGGKMKKLNTSKLLTSSLLGLIAFSGQAYALTTGEINLSGTVDPEYSISVSEAGAASDLDIVNGESATNIATVTELSNDPAGYKVQLRSTNAGKIVNEDDSGAFVTYSLSYNGSSITPTASFQDARTEASAALTPGNTSEVTITFTGLGTSATAGEYTDTIELEIGAP